VAAAAIFERQVTAEGSLSVVTGHATLAGRRKVFRRARRADLFSLW